MKDITESEYFRRQLHNNLTVKYGWIIELCNSINLDSVMYWSDNGIVDDIDNASFYENERLALSMKQQLQVKLNIKASIIVVPAILSE